LVASLDEKFSKESEAIKEIVDAIASGKLRNKQELESAKRYVAEKYRLDQYIPNTKILSELPDQEKRRYSDLIRVHPRRSASGIIVVTAFSLPHICPHGTCIFCPGGPPEGTPQSYVADGPGMKSAMALKFDPFLQIRRSLQKYAENGHDTSKVEAIIEGGTFMALPRFYQLDFVKGIYDGLNGFALSSLEESQSMNESAKSRCVGLTIESKPDWCETHHIDQMLSYGVTRLEIGVQSLRDDVLKISNRGHTTKDSINALKRARDSGLKVVCHMMPGLPGSTPENDLSDLKRLFEDEDFRPDMMKVYPTLIVRGTALAKMYESGRYRPYDLETVVNMLAEMKKVVPRWHRIMRIQREIPEKDILGGVKNGNLRELVLRRVAENGYSCNCIRCREVALHEPQSMHDDELRLTREEYNAARGLEIFCSYEFKRSKRIAAFIRMRYPSEEAHREEIHNLCIIRELKVYGKVVSVGEDDEKAWQHRGLGSSLLDEMEKVAREEFDSKRLVVISAVGTRNYYGRLGYKRLGPYMAKAL
jgi:elongator complex protein 3